MEQEFAFRDGMEVISSDGGKVGKIVEVEADYIVVEKGFFFPSDHFIPRNAISSVGEDDRIHLNVTKDAALNQGWEVPTESAFDDRVVASPSTSGAGHATDSSSTSAGFDTSGEPVDEVVAGQTRRATPDPMLPEAENPTSYAGDPAYRDDSSGTDRVVTDSASQRLRRPTDEASTGAERWQAVRNAEANRWRSRGDSESDRWQS